MLNFKSLPETTAIRIVHEIVRVIHDNEEICTYVVSGKAVYFGFDSSEELWEDRILFRPNRTAQLLCCTDYIFTVNDEERAERVVYMLNKLKTTFRDWEDEKILEEVRKFIS